MKKILSVSLGSSQRNHTVTTTFCGQDFHIERMGTDGDKRKAIDLISHWDGKVDAFGLGGTDLYIYAGGKRYTFRESKKIAAAAKQTPLVDGSGLKNTLERWMVKGLTSSQDFSFCDKHILVMCAVDRFGLAEALVEAGGKVIFGDLLFAMGLNIPIRTLKGLSRLAQMAAPVITQLPIHWLYPVGASQLANIPRFSSYFDQADVIAGDFHFIRRYMPPSLPGKTVITNTVTTDDAVMLKSRGVTTLVTTTPALDGRAFGTNVVEAIIVAYAEKDPKSLSPGDYEDIIREIGLAPQVSRW